MISSFITHFASAPVYAGIAAIVACAGASVWLWFWLREDEHPEPLRLLALAFFAGALIVPFVVPLQRLGYELYIANQPLMVTSWALVEELYKYGIALLLILWRRALDEPIDYVIYMIMIGVGFATFENVLYLYKTLIEVNGTAILPLAGTPAGAELIRVGAMRFIGASLVHIVSSATIGVAMAFAFTASQRIRLLAGLLGLSTATLLHTLFNLTIMSQTQTASSLGAVFLGVWISVIVLLLFMERIKRVRTQTNA
ncbi:hypothetical protein A3C89_00150 [Candidatus Kaiserbacteria bacterium RIFCSPHIGHO2_02_FULL_50_50]|uniref:Protease PrsW n=1 Tax=Candidatus Kaiserbacteria bacterium RIFCSPHIGHO2_02_FULL_50_50 TaxID=1798492 RepID=A0A1F6DDW6_9BACT|nr:MAG: hypothetical protein A3C89_00150 [Candidatus Kaiserbacteria bacterium RIFCSPHIGHO2_02_FULL_50_50]OGG88678.1 MAG: hypothetical protein A3G62_02010 [Candidatus Kaiserbacteria bacterium RIFCSPLOWO2_12_FULL_50_10]